MLAEAESVKTQTQKKQSKRTRGKAPAVQSGPGLVVRWRERGPGLVVRWREREDKTPASKPQTEKIILQLKMTGFRDTSAIIQQFTPA